MSYFENGRAPESVVKGRNPAAPEIGRNATVAITPLAVSPPVSETAMIAEELQRTLGAFGHAAGSYAGLVDDYNRQQARIASATEARAIREQAARDEQDRAQQAEIRGIAARHANTLQADLVGQIESSDHALANTGTAAEVATQLIRQQLPENSSGIYSEKFYDTLIGPLSTAVVNKRQAVQKVERDAAQSNLSNAVFAAKSQDEVADAMGEAKRLGIDPQAVLTNGVQALSKLGDKRAIEFAAGITDPEVRAAVVVSAQQEADKIASERRMGTLNSFSLAVQNVGENIGDISALRSQIQEFQASNPEARDTAQSLVGTLDSRLKNIRQNAVRASVEQREAEFKANAQAAINATVASAVESGRGYAVVERAEVSGVITYTDADGLEQSKQVSYAQDEGDVERAIHAGIHQTAAKASGGDPVVYRRTRLDEFRRNALVDKDLSRIASAGVAKLSEYVTANSDTPMPQEALEGFMVYRDSRDIGPATISISDYERKVYDLANTALDSRFVTGDPSLPQSMADALRWAIRAAKNPDGGRLPESATGAIASAARSVTAEWFDVNLNEEGRVEDVTEFIRNKAAFYFTSGVTLESSIAAATKDAKEYGRRVNGHWTYTYAPLPKANNGKTLDENIGIVAEKFANDYGQFNIQNESILVPGSSKLSRRDVKFRQLPSGRWAVTDSRNPYGTSLVINERGERLPELTTTQLQEMVENIVTTEIVERNRVMVSNTSARYDLGVPPYPPQLK